LRNSFSTLYNRSTTLHGDYSTHYRFITMRSAAFAGRRKSEHRWAGWAGWRQNGQYRWSGL